MTPAAREVCQRCFERFEEGFSTTLDCVNYMLEGGPSAARQILWEAGVREPIRRAGSEAPGDLGMSQLMEGVFLRAAKLEGADSRRLLVEILREPQALATLALAERGVDAQRVERAASPGDPAAPAPRRRSRLIPILVLVLLVTLGPLLFNGATSPEWVTPGALGSIGVSLFMAFWALALSSSIAASPWIATEKLERGRCSRCGFSQPCPAAYRRYGNKTGPLYCLDCLRRRERRMGWIAVALIPAGLLAMHGASDDPGRLYVLAGLWVVPVVSLSILVHEFAHNLAARLVGLRVLAVHAGSPWGPAWRFRLLGTPWRVRYPFSRGVNLLNWNWTATQLLLTVLAGPLATTALAVGLFLAAARAGAWGDVIRLAAYWNVMLLLFNMVPRRLSSGGISDGAYLLGLCLDRRRTRWHERLSLLATVGELSGEGELSLAMSVVEALGDSVPFHLRVWYAGTLIRLGRRAEGLEALESLRGDDTLAPRYRALVLNSLAWGLLWQKMGQPADPEQRARALELAAEARRLDSDSAYPRGTYATALILDGRHEEGAALLESVLPESTDSREAALDACALAVARRDAGATLKLARLIDPECPLLGWADRQLG